MPTARPGYVYDGTQWVAIGSQANTTPVKIQSTAPATPATGDIWIDTSTYIPSIDSAVIANIELLSYLGL